MKSLTIRVVTPGRPAPVPVLPPSRIRIAHDHECRDPVHGMEEGWLPRVWGTDDILPSTEKFVISDGCEMDLPWAQLQFDVMAYYFPRSYRTDPPIGLNDEWTGGHRFKSYMEEVYIHFIHGARFKTNHKGPNNLGRYDPVTGYGTPNGNEPMKPYEFEGLTCTGNELWSAGKDGNRMRFWCIDYLAPPPTVEQLVNHFFLINIATQVTPICIDPTPRENPHRPNGDWQVIPFWHGEENLVPFLVLSRDKNMPTMEWNGLHLRQNMLEMTRVLEVPAGSPFSNPYVPGLQLCPKE